MDEKTREILNRIDEWAKMVRRYMKHDIDCAIWRNDYPVCDCGLDAALSKMEKVATHG
jgi:hypothetical protein